MGIKESVAFSTVILSNLSDSLSAFLRACFFSLCKKNTLKKKKYTHKDTGTTDSHHERPSSIPVHWQEPYGAGKTPVNPSGQGSTSCWTYKVLGVPGRLALHSPANWDLNWSTLPLPYWWHQRYFCLHRRGIQSPRLYINIILCDVAGKGIFFLLREQKRKRVLQWHSNRQLIQAKDTSVD